MELIGSQHLQEQTILLAGVQILKLFSDNKYMELVRNVVALSNTMMGLSQNPDKANGKQIVWPRMESLQEK